jgi:hypothetical protein
VYVNILPVQITYCMIYLKTLIPRIFNLIFIVVILSGCSKNKPGIYKDNLIPSGTRSELHSFDDELLSALKKNVTEGLEMLMSQEYIDSRAERMKVCEEISIRMKQADYSLMKEYYVFNPVVSGNVTVQERNLGIGNCDLTFNRGTQEMCVAFFTPKTASQKWLITAYIYKYDYGWKVNNLEISPYAENGKTAPELIAQAKELAKKSYWLDASNTASYAVKCIRPSGCWKYVNEQEIIHYNGEALMAVSAHCKLPLIVNTLPTHPHIWRITIERTPEGAFPNINYTSDIKLYNTDELKKENDALGKIIGKLLPGVDKDKKYIYYTVYNKNAQGTIPVQDHHDFQQKL